MSGLDIAVRRSNLRGDTAPVNESGGSVGGFTQAPPPEGGAARLSELPCGLQVNACRPEPEPCKEHMAKKKIVKKTALDGLARAAGLHNGDPRPRITRKLHYNGDRAEQILHARYAGQWETRGVSAAHGGARVIVESYGRIMEDELAKLSLTEPEALVVLEACNSIPFSPEFEPFIAWLIGNHMGDLRSHEHPMVDKHGLFERLKVLSVAGQVALADAIDQIRFPAAHSADTPLSVRLRQVGLVAHRVNVQ